MTSYPTTPVTRPPIRAEISGNQIEVIESGEDRLHALLALITGAEHSIKMLMYMFNPDHAGGIVHDALLAAARRGVEVGLLIDGFGSGAPPRFFADLGDAGGRYCVFNPSWGRRYLLRNHQKLIVADDRVALIGGANIDNSYLTDDGDNRWRDLWLRIEGPEVALAGRYFSTLFRWSHRKHSGIGSLRRMLSEYSEWRGPLQWKFSGPLSMRNSWWRSIGRDLRKARRLDLMFAYWAPPGAMIRRIGRVGRRGQVRVVNASRSDNNTTIAAARHSYSRLLRRNVKLFEYQPTKLHTKLAIVDDVVHIGSSNFDYRSFYINLELMLRIHDAAFADQMRAYFDRELTDCKEITLELHHRRATFLRRVKWAISNFLVNVADYTVTRRLNFRPER
ncbi:MAG: phosphatidylserine/phosphatidylglycerophosphate/cardiolipin synthase family protein [Sphingomicrobium sp.]